MLIEYEILEKSYKKIENGTKRNTILNPCFTLHTRPYMKVCKSVTRSHKVSTLPRWLLTPLPSRMCRVAKVSTYEPCDQSKVATCAAHASTTWDFRHHIRSESRYIGTHLQEIPGFLVRFVDFFRVKVMAIPSYYSLKPITGPPVNGITCT